MNEPARVRPLNAPVPIAAEANAEGEPVAVLWRGVYQGVVRIHDSWRIDDEWWRDEISRRYFVVELESGRRLTLYHDLVHHDAWFMQAGPPAARGGSRLQGA
jgi:hypothetical protein